MQMISSKLATHNHNHQIFLAKRSSFKCQTSPLNPATKPASCNIAAAAPQHQQHQEFTRKHLANLEKLLLHAKQPDEPARPAADRIVPVTKNSHGRSQLEGLNLSRIWPELKAAEEMSPRHLNRLKRLLSKTVEYSPRNNLGSRWREYHGSNHWAGLLDPLDENLRREVVRYGEFVQAAYHAFHSNPGFSEDDAATACQRRHVALPDKCYKVTKSLYSTSSVGLPSWVDEVAPDLGWMTQRSSWIGYVAVCDDRREIQRMGRRDIVISLRGTSTCLEWAENFRAQLVPMPDNNNDDPQAHDAKVECGFMSLLKTRGARVPSLAESVVQEVQRLVNLYKEEGEPLSITITGHSLGSALAILVADELMSCSCDGEPVPPIAVFTFGGPRVGNRAFADRVNSKGIKVLRIVNNQDVITKVPPSTPTFVDDHQQGAKEQKPTRGSGLGGMLSSMSYSHVGTELRLETKMSPYLKPNADVACCHDLEAYLHLVDGFLSSNCPFRTNAKRSLAKLVNEQRSNVKQLYTSKAKALTLNLHTQAKGGLPSPMSCLPSPS